MEDIPFCGRVLSETDTGGIARAVVVVVVVSCSCGDSPFAAPFAVLGRLVVWRAGELDFFAMISSRRFQNRREFFLAKRSVVQIDVTVTSSDFGKERF